MVVCYRQSLCHCVRQQRYNDGKVARSAKKTPHGRSNLLLIYTFYGSLRIVLILVAIISGLALDTTPGASDSPGDVSTSYRIPSSDQTLPKICHRADKSHHGFSYLDLDPVQFEALKVVKDKLSWRRWLSGAWYISGNSSVWGYGCI